MREGEGNARDMVLFMAVLTYATWKSLQNHSWDQRVVQSASHKTSRDAQCNMCELGNKILEQDLEISPMPSCLCRERIG